MRAIPNIPNYLLDYLLRPAMPLSATQISCGHGIAGAFFP